MTISILLQPFNLRKHKTDHYKTETGHVHQASQTSLQIQQEKGKKHNQKATQPTRSRPQETTAP